MAYTLKTTGVAAKAISIVAVDEDGTTVKDFVTGRTGTYDAAITAPRIGTATWKGVTRSHFKTDYGADIYAPRGYVPGATLPPIAFGNGGAGVSYFCAANSLTDAQAGNVLWLTADNNNGAKIGTGGKLVVYAGASERGLGLTTLPALTKISFGFNQKYNTASLPFFYGLESGSLAADGTYNEGGFGGASTLGMIGGATSVQSGRGQYFLVALFSDATLLTTVEMQSLHNDWFNTLFEATTIPFAGNGSLTTLRVRALPATGAFGVVYRLTGQLVDPSTGLPRANVTGINAAFFDESTPSALTTPKQVITNLSTDASGFFSWSVPNSALTVGQIGTFIVYHSVLGYLGAYRVPVVT